ncbi:MAG TPA: hypothetical protein PLF21_06130 [Exilispira sp.]|nr:hypothetical protein [Exilispira sp.]
MNRKILIFIVFGIFILPFLFISLQSNLFDSFKLESEKDIFLEFEVDKTLQYNLFVIDSYNSEAFGAKYTLEYAIVSVYQKDKKTAYPSNIYKSPFKEGGITTSEKEYVASFKPLDNLVYVRIRGTSIKSNGTFGLALLSSKNKKVSYKLSKSIFDDLHKEAMKKYDLEQYKITEAKAIKITYIVEKDKEYKLTLVDSYNNNLFGTYFTLEGLWFHIMDENNNYYEAVYSSDAEDGGITSLSVDYSAKFTAKSNIINILVEPISLIYEGTFGIKLESDSAILKPKEINWTNPIGYESKIESIFTEKTIDLDIIEIKNLTLTISFNTVKNKTYYIYLADFYNAEIYQKEFSFKDLFFQIFDKDNKLLENCYASDITYEDQVGGITMLNAEPSATFEAETDLYYIRIKSFSKSVSGTFGILIIDSDQKIVTYQILEN